MPMYNIYVHEYRYTYNNWQLCNENGAYKFALFFPIFAIDTKIVSTHDWIISY